ncbi:MAG TPA: LuxR C-terminal-related transcriptional regulator [Gammaproteobacteria bacterium]|nr:LuxR C-terminal-related transcriptional regulator [Gammaproteobacteria bacterium]
MRATGRKRRGRPPHEDVLTPGEWRTVHAAQHGMTNREIAERRGISIDAVKYHVANALEKLGLRSRRELRGWFQVPADSALSRQEKAMDQKLELGRIGQISRMVRNIAEAQRFYGELLGLRHLYTFGKLAFFDCGGTRLYLDEKEEVQPESILYLQVQDIAAAHAELASRGVEFMNPPHMIFRHGDGTEEWMTFFKDPEGRPLALMAQVKA